MNNRQIKFRLLANDIRFTLVSSYFFLGTLLVKLFQYYKWSFVKFLYEDNPKPWHECQVLLRPIAHTFASNYIRSDNRKVTNHDVEDDFKSIFVNFISNNASGKSKYEETMKINDRSF